MLRTKGENGLWNSSFHDISLTLGREYVYNFETLILKLELELWAQQE